MDGEDTLLEELSDTDCSAIDEYIQGDIDALALVEILTTIEVEEVRDPKDAINDRGNPEVLVAVNSNMWQWNRILFEFVHPKHSVDNRSKYTTGKYQIEVYNQHSLIFVNDAQYKAAKALAEHTEKIVEQDIRPLVRVFEEGESGIKQSLSESITVHRDNLKQIIESPIVSTWFAVHIALPSKDFLKNLDEKSDKDFTNPINAVE